VQHQLTLTHPKVPAAAFQATTVMPDGPRLWSIHFVSRTRDGHTLLTRKRASISGPLPLRDVHTNDVWLPDWPAVWKSHVAAMRGMAPKSLLWAGMTSQAWAHASADADRAAFQVRQLHRQLVWAGDGGYRVSWGWAVAMLGRVWRVAHHTWRPMAADRVAAAKAHPPTLSALINAYEHHSQRPGMGGSSTGAKWLLSFASAGLAALSFGMNMDLQALAALLLVHEGGHYAALRWAGYQDLKVFFLPFLGAAVSGRHEQPSSRQEFVVLFAGPLPGLVLGRSVLLAFVGVVALGLPKQGREARVARALRAQGRHAGLARPAALKALFSTIAQLGYAAWPGPARSSWWTPCCPPRAIAQQPPSRAAGLAAASGGRQRRRRAVGPAGA
jgi:hypothetical protein